MASYSTITKGSTDKSAIKTWQNYLISQEYDIGSTGADGVFGSKTLEATKQYQRDKGLAVDGIVGKNTWASMTSNTAKTNTSATNTTTNNVKSAAENAVTSGVNAALGSVSIAPNGVNQSDWNEALSDFSGSKELNGLYNEKQNQYEDTKEILSQDEIIDQATKDKMNKELVFSDAYYQAMDVMNAKLQELTDGKTKWTDQYEAAMNNYLNREDFEYDVDKDPLFQQALASAMNSGKSAMQDTIGQASSLTGGYGSTYATSAGNQAYNAFIEDAYNNLPEYYNMALQAYQAEGQEMYNQVAMLGEADANEFQREYTEWQASFDNANNLWNQEFNTWQAETNQAYNSANIQLQEYGQKAENAYNLYNMASNQYESLYAKEFDNWQARINQLFNSFEIQNSDYWSQTNFDESVRQFDKTYEQTETWNQKELDYKYDALKQDQDQFDATFNASYTKNSDGTYSPKGNTTGSNFSLTDTDMSSIKEVYDNAGGGKAGEDAVVTYLAQRGKTPTTEEYKALVEPIFKGGSSTTNGKTKVNLGSVSTSDGNSGFRPSTKSGADDNFDVTYDGETYRVENKGEVTNKTTIENLNKIDAGHKSVFVYNGDAYVKYSGKYYKIGATNILWHETSGYSNLLKAMTKSKESK